MPQLATSEKAVLTKVQKYNGHGEILSIFAKSFCGLLICAQLYSRIYRPYMEGNETVRYNHGFHDRCKHMRILVCDGLEKTGVDKLRSAAVVTVDEQPSISADELFRIIDRYEALIVRSKTRVTAELINHATNLRVVGRAGTGVDNIDVSAAT